MGNIMKPWLTSHTMKPWLKSFMQWWDKHGGKAHMGDMEDCYRAGWKAAVKYKRERRRARKSARGLPSR